MSANNNGADVRVRRTRADIARTVLAILARQGVSEVTHARVAELAGYSKTTLYTHWPARADLLVVALDSVGAMPHGPQTGDRRTQLIGELQAFRDGIVDDGLATILVILAEWGAGVDDIAAIRDRIVTDGQSVVRELLSKLVDGPRLDAAVHLLTGAVLCPTLMHATPPDDGLITTAVDIVLTGCSTPRTGPTGGRAA